MIRGKEVSARVAFFDHVVGASFLVTEEACQEVNIFLDELTAGLPDWEENERVILRR